MKMLFCSNDTSNTYGESLHAVLKTIDSNEKTSSYLYVVEQDVVLDYVWMNVNNLLIDSSINIVRIKTDTEFLFDAKQSIIKKIQEKKTTLRDGGFDVEGVHFDSDLEARMAYAELAIRLQGEPTFETQWKANDGSWVTMNAALFSKVVYNGQMNMQNAFAWQAMKLAELESINTIEMIDSFVI